MTKETAFCAVMEVVRKVRCEMELRVLSRWMDVFRMDCSRIGSDWREVWRSLKHRAGSILNSITGCQVALSKSKGVAR